MSVESTDLFHRRGAREARVMRLMDGVVVSGHSFYYSAIVTQPGLVLMYTEGTLPLAAVPPVVEVITEEAARSGPVVIVNDAELYTFYEHGVRERWAEAVSKHPPIIRATHILVTATMTAMSLGVLRMATGASIHPYDSRHDFEKAVRKLRPIVELDRMEKRIGR